MADYTAPLDDIQFLLNDVFQLPKQWESNENLAEVIDLDTATAMLNECGKLSAELIAPLSRNGDEEGCQFDQGKVTTATGYKEAYQAYSEGGWGGLTGNPEFGGLGMPKALAIHCEEMFTAADISFSLFPMLTSGACLSIEQHASDELKNKYLEKMYSGEWAGSMCLTEPHAGTDLGIIRSKAVPNDQGSYDITGSKIFITGGEQDLTENIIHLVLAKLPDAPAGAKGISLFLVPKVLDDGTRNTVSCGSIEHKMGINASSTCAMNFDSATGFLVGEKHRGLMAMFTMMNYERVGVGIQGLGPAERSYQCAAAYAKDRLQGRSPQSNLDANQAENLLVHPDVRRMLLTMRAFTEAGRCFITYTANQLDLAKFGNDDEKQKANEKVALLTPLVKAFCTDRGFESCVMGQQVLGGHGFIREWGQEQLVRDVRITQIYEGTNGVQAMDLLGRKVVPNKGAGVKILTTEINDFANANQSILSSDMFDALQQAAQDLQSTTDYIIDNASSELIGSTAVYYQDLMGYVVYAYMWAKMSVAASSDSKLHHNKKVLADFYFNHLLSRANALTSCIRNNMQSIMEFSDDDF
ncbi:MAG: acyl-CoA dehydrogenase [Sinobacterium sp.]|nr:acyl-CoA dehydrogenase [Sinobacterium sp.]